MAELTNPQQVMEDLDKLEHKDAIVELIRKKYSQDDEAALTRKMIAIQIGFDTDEEHIAKVKEEWKAYYVYVEECKKRVNK